MSLIDSALAFVDGIKSVIDVSEAAKGTITNAMSDGIEQAFLRIKKPIERSLLKISFIVVSFLLIVWGLAMMVDDFVPYHGLGFVFIGAIFGVVVLVFYTKAKTGHSDN